MIFDKRPKEKTLQMSKAGLKKVVVVGEGKNRISASYSSLNRACIIITTRTCWEDIDVTALLQRRVSRQLRVHDKRFLPGESCSDQ